MLIEYKEKTKKNQTVHTYRGRVIFKRAALCKTRRSMGYLHNIRAGQCWNPTGFFSWEPNDFTVKTYHYIFLRAFYKYFDVTLS